MFDIDPKHHDLTTDRRCWSSLSLMAFSLVIAALYRVSWLALFYTGHIPNIGAYLGWDQLDFWLRTLSTWSKLLGSFGLIFISKDVGWRRRGMLFFWCGVIDTGLWAVDSSKELGLAPDSSALLDWFKGQEWLRYGIGTAVGWSEFMLVTLMFAEIGVAYSVERTEGIAQSIRKLTSVGMVIWMIFYLAATRWAGPNPIALKRLTLETFLLWQAVRLIWTICLLRTAALALIVLEAVGGQIRRDLQSRRQSEEWPFD